MTGIVSVTYTHTHTVCVHLCLNIRNMKISKWFYCTHTVYVIFSPGSLTQPSLEKLSSPLGLNETHCNTVLDPFHRGGKGSVQGRWAELQLFYRKGWNTSGVTYLILYQERGRRLGGKEDDRCKRESFELKPRLRWSYRPWIYLS